MVSSTTVDTMQRALASRGVKRVVHFHCDHFEPFRADKGGQRIGLQHVKAWDTARRQSPLGGAPSLFLHTKGICYVPSPDQARLPNLHKAADIYFADSSVAEEEQEIYAFLREQADLDFQVHLHHEYWTASSCLQIPLDPARDAARVREALKLNLAYYEKHLGLQPHGWGFVHGCWALNASDRTICNVTSELMILHSLGCIADFSFPAGRPWCDPSLKHPFTILPIDAERCFDDLRAQPIKLERNAKAWTPDRVLIWSCAAPTGLLSLDSLVDQPAPEPTASAAALAWVTGCPVIDDTLYVKTHGHSLRWSVWESGNSFRSLFTSPASAVVYDALQHACEGTGVKIEHLSVAAVMAELAKLDGGRE